MTFKIGDRVRVVRDKFIPEYVGATGVITDIYQDDDTWPFAVKFDEAVAARNKTKNDVFAAHELELLPHLMNNERRMVLKRLQRLNPQGVGQGDPVYSTEVLKAVCDVLEGRV